MLDRDQLETFATVAEEQSFERAAMKLNVTRGAVSQRIKTLEESLATVLLVRERPVTPTPAGEILLRHVQAMRLLEGAALNELMPTPRPNLPVALAIAVNADSLATWFQKVLQQILLKPQTTIEVISDDQDHTSARLARGEVIGCISTDAKPAVGFLAESLGAMTYRCCAMPAFAAKHFPNGLTVPGVLAAPAVLFNRKDSLHDDFLTRLFGFTIDRYAKHYLPSPAVLLEAIAIGAGYGLVPGAQCEPLILDGQLVDLAPYQAVDVALYWHHWALEPLLARDITGLIVDIAREHLNQAQTAGEVENASHSSPSSFTPVADRQTHDPATSADTTSPTANDTRSSSPKSMPDLDAP